MVFSTFFELAGTIELIALRPSFLGLVEKTTSTSYRTRLGFYKTRVLARISHEYKTILSKQSSYMFKAEFRKYFLNKEASLPAGLVETELGFLLETAKKSLFLNSTHHQRKYLLYEKKFSEAFVGLQSWKWEEVLVSGHEKWTTHETSRTKLNAVYSDFVCTSFTGATNVILEKHFSLPQFTELILNGSGGGSEIAEELMPVPLLVHELESTYGYEVVSVSRPPKSNKSSSMNGDLMIQVCKFGKEFPIFFELKRTPDPFNEDISKFNSNITGSSFISQKLRICQPVSNLATGDFDSNVPFLHWHINSPAGNVAMNLKGNILITYNENAKKLDNFKK
jgi:hypothetical protein